MSSARASTVIRQWGKIYCYFDCKVGRESWEGLAYAHGRSWRVLGTTPSGHGMEKFKCEPLRVSEVGGWETEVPNKEND